MKKHLLIWILFIPMILVAQIEPRYQAGAVPLVDGKVVFTHQIAAPGLSQGQIYDKLHNWAGLHFNTEQNRIAYTAREKGSMALTGDKNLVFSSTALGLDQSQMVYRVIIQSEDNACQVQVSNIRYIYNVSYQKEPERFVAEEIITDKAAISKNKLNRLNGKFRKATIDHVDELFTQMEVAVTGNTVTTTASTQAPQPVPVVSATPQATTPQAVSTPAVKEGYMAFDADKVPQSLLQLIPESSMLVTPGESGSPVESGATWKGINTMFGKKVATVSLPAESEVHKQISGNFTLSFRKEPADAAPWMIIECKKQGETTENTNITIIGEILHIWIK